MVFGLNSPEKDVTLWTLEMPISHLDMNCEWMILCHWKSFRSSIDDICWTPMKHPMMMQCHLRINPTVESVSYLMWHFDVACRILNHFLYGKIAVIYVIIVGGRNYKMPRENGQRIEKSWVHKKKVTYV